MANLEQPDGEGSLPAADGRGAGISAHGAARRRFAKAGASAGAILTLASQPAMATGTCTSPSGFLSGNLSRHNHQVPCSGLLPLYWRDHHYSWRSAGCNGKSKFSDNFPTLSRCSHLNTYTCYDIVDTSKVTNRDDATDVAMYIMATLLNVRSGRIGFLTETQVKEIWYAYASTGVYKPKAGVSWSGREIVNYLSSTMS